MRVIEIHKGLYRITTPYAEGRGTVFLYLLKGDSIALLDTGTSESPQAVLRPALAEIGLALSDVDLIVSTHAHQDHVGGNLEVQQASSARVYMPAAELAFAQSPQAVADFMMAPMRILEYPPAMLERRWEYITRGMGQPAKVDVALSDGDTVDLGAGIVLRAIHTPGHSPGSTSYYWEQEGVLLTADAVQGRSGGMFGAFPLYFNATDYRRTLARVAGLDFRLLCLGHAFLGGGALNDPTRDVERGRAFLKDAMETADTLHKVVADTTRRMPGATKHEIVLAALSELIYHLPVMLVRETGMPPGGGETVLGHLQAVLDGSYPA